MRLELAMLEGVFLQWIVNGKDVHFAMLTSSDNRLSAQV